jgi:hypothetical protein
MTERSFIVTQRLMIADNLGFRLTDALKESISSH